jgi:hypothetical protein
VIVTEKESKEMKNRKHSKAAGIFYFSENERVDAGRKSRRTESCGAKRGT